MNKIYIKTFLLFMTLIPTMLFTSCKPENTENTSQRVLEPGTYAIFTIKGSVEGRIICRLFDKDAPKTVENFVALAQGRKEWLNPSTGKSVKDPFYDGLIFHRVIPNFMIQGGCPMGNGMGGPGYKFDDEFALTDGTVVKAITSADQAAKIAHRFEGPGILAMANSGPQSNGSQFFITVAPTPHLNGHHTIFGEVVDGMEVANKISLLPGDQGNKPNDKVYIDKLKIEVVK